MADHTKGARNALRMRAEQTMKRFREALMVVLVIAMCGLPAPTAVFAEGEEVPSAISYAPVSAKVYYEGIDQYYEEDGSGPFYNEEEAIQPGDRVTATFADRTEVYVAEIDEDGLPYFVNEATGETVHYSKWNVMSDQRTGTKWGTGSHRITLDFMGATTTIPVTVQKNPVQYIEFTLGGRATFFAEDVAQTIESDEGQFTFYDVYTNRAPDFFIDGDKVALKFEDPVRGKITYTYSSERGGFYSKTGSAVPYPVFYDDYYGQYEEHWDFGSNTQWIYCAGCASSVEITILSKEGGWVTRVAGSDRYQTAFRTADALRKEMGVEKFSTVILASGDNFPDALCGSYLAYKRQAPILITSRKGKAYESVNRYIEDNLESGGTVYVLGGTAAIGDDMVSELSEDFEVQRLQGADRYATNLAILEEAGITDEDFLIASGAGFADSLSASAVKRPILLVGSSMTPEQEEFFTDERFNQNKVYILGGEKAVGADVEAVITGCGRDFERLSGATRYDTSVAIAEEFFKDPGQAAIAYAWLYPDGLCGGPLAAEIGCPMLLTKSGEASAAITYAGDHEIRNGIVLGGTAYMTNKVVKQIYQLETDAQILDFVG